MRKLGYGEGYRYPHDSEGALNEQHYLPDELGERRYYEPSERGYEGRLRDYLQRARLARKSGKRSAAADYRQRRPNAAGRTSERDMIVAITDKRKSG